MTHQPRFGVRYDCGKSAGLLSRASAMPAGEAEDKAVRIGSTPPLNPDSTDRVSRITLSAVARDISKPTPRELDSRTIALSMIAGLCTFAIGAWMASLWVSFG